MMRLRNVLLFVCLWSLCGCNDWLDVNPKTEVRKDDLFSSQNGFRDALVGAYIQMKSNSLYGRELVFSTPEYLVQHWTQTPESPWADYDYHSDALESGFSEIYGKMYSLIASVNSILEELEQADKGMFEDGWYELLKGESLGIRAYAHFDLLRLWGPVPTNVRAGTVLPYVRTVTTGYHEHLSYEEYTRLLEEDLLEAERCLKLVDPLLESSVEETKERTDFFGSRQIRMNYYAVKALQARFYLWKQDEEKANACAMEVINAKDHAGQPIFRLADEGDLSELDYSLACEHIFAMHIYNLYDVVNSAFSAEGTYEMDKTLVANELFDLGTTDWRWARWWRQSNNNEGVEKNYIIKFVQPEEDGLAQLPLIRLAEMYFIAMETTTPEEATRLYEEICIARNIPVGTVFHSEEEVRSVLLSEYNKEFYAEGQMFYAYKRMNSTNILWSNVPGSEEVYVIPLPENEISYQ